MRVTIICPVGLIADGNQLAMVLGFTAADVGTYGEPSWQDVDGNLYAAASLETGSGFVASATSALARPEWDTNNSVNMAGAARAQAAVVIWGLPQGAEADPVPPAVPGVILAMFGDDPLGFLAAAGLTRIPAGEDA